MTEDTPLPPLAALRQSTAPGPATDDALRRIEQVAAALRRMSAPAGPAPVAPNH